MTVGLRLTFQGMGDSCSALEEEAGAKEHVWQGDQGLPTCMLLRRSTAPPFQGRVPTRLTEAAASHRGIISFHCAVPPFPTTAVHKRGLSSS